MVIDTHIKVCVTKPNFTEKDFLHPQIGKIGQKEAFRNLLKNLVINFYRICSIMKIYIICCVPEQIFFFRDEEIRLQDFSIRQNKSMK